MCRAAVSFRLDGEVVTVQVPAEDGLVGVGIAFAEAGFRADKPTIDCDTVEELEGRRARVTRP